MYASPSQSARSHARVALPHGLFVLAACALAACSGHGCGSSPPAHPPPPPTVEVTRIHPQPVTVYDDYIARVRAPETVEIRSQVTGTLKQILFNEGAHVDEGDVLYRIDARPFEAAVHQAEANMAQARSRAANANQNVARYRELYRRSVVSEQEYSAYVTAAESANATVQAQEAAVRDARVNLGYAAIRAPEAGMVNRSRVRAGTLVTAEQTLLTTLYAGDTLFVYFAVSQEDRASLTRPPLTGNAAVSKPGTEGGPPPRTYEIVLDDGTALPAPGRLDFVAPAVDDATGTIQARLNVPSTDHRLLPGQLVRVRVPILARRDGILVPQRAVSELQGLKSVFVVRDGKVHSQRIQASHRVDNAWLVDEGLSPGETVVVEGTGKVHDGQPVRTVPYSDGE